AASTFLPIPLRRKQTSLCLSRAALGRATFCVAMATPVCRSRAEHSRNVDSSVLEYCVRGRDCSEVASSAGEWYPGRRRDLAILVDHLGSGVGGAAGRIKERRRPIGERDPGSGGAIGLEVTETVRHRLPHSVRVNT